MKALILAGGSGERFWPLSTSNTPKQFLKLFGDKSLIKQTFERLLYGLKAEDIFVVTSEENIEKLLKELPEIPIENVIKEPFKRNTAPACFLGILAIGPDEVILTVPCDHRIPDFESFWESVDKAIHGVNKYGGLYTFGIKPTRPETGYGYIEIGKKLEDGIYEVSRFREKPNLETAMEFLKSGKFYWNSGMFVWRGVDFIEEVKRTKPVIYEKLIGVNFKDEEDLKKRYMEIPDISVDYAVLERSSNIKMVEGEFEWSDVGNWSSIVELEGYSEDEGNVVLIDSEKIFVKTNKKPVAVIGLSRIVVIDSPDGILVCHEDHVQRVKDVVRKLKNRRYVV